MISPDHAALVRRDAVLPGLALLLDADALVDRLREAVPDRPIDGLRPTYLRYKPGENCLAGYRLTLGGAETHLHAKAYRPNSPVKLRKAHERRGLSNTALGRVRVLFDDIAVVVSPFPNDAKLKNLLRIVAPESKAKFLRELMPDMPALWESAIEDLNYKPERRYVGRLRATEPPGAVIKLYTESAYQAAHVAAEQFVSQGALKIPRLLGFSPQRHALAFQWIEGQRLRELIASETNIDHEVEMVGAALADLHRQSAPALAAYRPRTAVTRLAELAVSIGYLCPSIARCVESLVEGITTRLGEAPRAMVPSHGDFYDKQVLLQSDGAAMIDLDEAALADPASDLGLFAAHLERDVALRGLPAERAERVKDTMIRSYVSGAPFDPRARIDLYTAVALVRLAIEPFRHMEPDWPQRIAVLVERAEQVLNNSPHSSIPLRAVAGGGGT